MLQAPDGQNSPLVEAVISGSRELQYAACKAIADINPKQAFPGCSYVGKMAVLLAASDGRSTGVAVDPRTDTAQGLASAVYQSGSVGTTAKSGQQLFELINTNPDVDFIMITDSVGRPSYQQLVQQLRSYWLSKHLPIAILTRNAQRERQAEWVFDRDPLTLVLPATTDPRLVFGTVKRLLDLRRQPVSDTQRSQHAKFAMKWLSELLADPQLYRFYHLVSHKDQLVELVKVPSDFDLKSEILAGLGTAASQQTLVDLAEDNSLAIGERQLMLAGFVDSTKRFGVLLPPSEIRAQYNRFNEVESQEAAKIVGSILEAIEDRAKNGPTVGSR